MKIAGTGLNITYLTTSSDVSGLARWRTLVNGALDNLTGRRDVPIIIGSCNGAADTFDGKSWSRAFADLGALPIASGACSSGLQALWVANARLQHDCEEVIVLAVDMKSYASEKNFETLRVLDANPAPWQPASAGFRHGEAAVAIRLVRGDGLVGPLLGNDNLAELVTAIGTDVDFVVGQGTGPVAVDDTELAALPSGLPIATALEACGHTIGASGLLSLALAARVCGVDPSRHARQRLDYAFWALAMRPPAIPDAAIGAPAIDPAATPVIPLATDGRPLGIPPAIREAARTHVERDDTARAAARSLVICRALGGATVVARIGTGHVTQTSRWVDPQPPPPLRIHLLRRIAKQPRPDKLPAAIIVRLDAPLVPPDDARIGGRLLPSVILEITPGFIAQLLARTWGFAGPAVTLVGGSDAGWVPTLAAIQKAHGEVLVLHVHARDFEWGT